MTTKGLSRKNIIMPINSDNIMRFMKKSSLYIANLNRSLKNIKSNVLVNFIHLNPLGITIITCKVALVSNLQVIENYVKSTNYIDSTGIEVLYLLQSKFYLKIISILYYQEGSINPIILNIIENIIKQNQIFDYIMLVFKPQVIKVLSRLDMAIIWVDIWDVQSGSKTRGLINCCFNVGNNIIIIRRANMNLEVFQCKNC